MKNNILFLFLVLFIIPIISCSKKRIQSYDFGFGNKAVSVFETLPEEDLVNFNLKTDFKNLIRGKAKPTYQPAILTYEDQFGNPFEWKIKVKPRGNMRREICYYPPLKIKFPKKALQARGMKEIKTMKIALGCQGRDIYQQYILREFLAYKMYHLLTEHSFKVKLAKIRIEDTEGKMKPVNSFAILIEHEKEMAERLDGRVVKQKIFEKRDLSEAAFDRLCLFQFMIGNTDWHVKNLHNLKLLALRSETKTVPVAYDFDYSGLVNTTYSVPKPGIDITHVTHRYYQGVCRDKEAMEPILQSFRDKKEAILELCETFPHLDKTSRKQLLKYMDSFYKILENPRKTKRQILKHCDQDS